MTFLPGLDDRALEPTAAPDGADLGAAGGEERLEPARWKLDRDLARGVRDDEGARAGGPNQATPVERVDLEIGDQGPVRDRRERKDAAAAERTRVERDRVPGRDTGGREEPEPDAGRGPDDRDRRRAAGGLRDVDDRRLAGDGGGRVVDGAVMPVARERYGPVPGAAPTGDDPFSHQNTPARPPMSSAEYGGANLTVAIFPSRTILTLTFATLQL